MASVILASVTVSLGLMLWGLATGWSFSSSLEFTHETDESIAQIQSSISVDLGYMSNGRCILHVRNIGDTPVKIMGVELYPEGGGGPIRPKFDAPDRIERDNVEILTIDEDTYCNSDSDKAVKVVIIYSAERTSNDPGRYLRLPYLLAPVNLIQGGGGGG
ncbi:hypothetical protein DRO64_09945, partial [Candidatus Bathyarchaeota archaeon]